MTTARATQISFADTPYYLCVTHCVRRAFLCGIDPLTDQNYQHRRKWLVSKMKSLTRIFSIDICAYVRIPAKVSTHSGGDHPPKAAGGDGAATIPGVDTQL